MGILFLKAIAYVYDYILFIMKLFISALALLCIGATGCERVAYCKNTCYTCYDMSYYKSHYELCEGDTNWRMTMEDLHIMGYKCMEVEPTMLTKLEGGNSEIQAQMNAMEGEYVDCYDEDDYYPSYFNYPEFIVKMDICSKCYSDIASEFAYEYADSVMRYTGFPSIHEIRPSEADTLEMIAQHYANIALQKHCGNANAERIKIPGYAERALQLMQYDSSLPSDKHDHLVAMNSWLDFIPAITIPMNQAIYPKCP